MQVYDQQGNLMETYDLALGRLEERTKTVQHPAIKGAPERWHWETLKEYPNGGRDVKKVIDVPGVQAREAWVEEVPYQVYIPYTQAELDAMEAERRRPTMEERLTRIEKFFEALLLKEET